MKNLQLIVFVFLVAACQSYNHEQYIATFKANVDAEINRFSKGDFDSISLARSEKETLERLKEEKIANDRFYADNYSWYQLGKNLMLNPREAKEKSIKAGFDRPYYFLEFLKCDSVVSSVKDEAINALKDRLLGVYSQDSVSISQSSARELFTAVDRCDTSKYFLFIKVDFEKVKNASVRQKKVASQMMQSAFNRLKEKVVVNDLKYHLTIASGEEIGISESLFTIGKNIYVSINARMGELLEKNPEVAQDFSLEEQYFKKITWEKAWVLHEVFGQ
jgi:hypothetical protein